MGRQDKYLLGYSLSGCSLYLGRSFCTFGLFMQGSIFRLSSVYLHNPVLRLSFGVGFVFNFFIFGSMAYLLIQALRSLLISLV